MKNNVVEHHHRLDRNACRKMTATNRQHNRTEKDSSQCSQSTLGAMKAEDRTSVPSKHFGIGLTFLRTEHFCH